MGILKFVIKSDADNTYLKNCIDYVISGHSLYHQCGSFNINPDEALMQMNYVKNYFRKTGRNQVVHIILSYNQCIYDENTAFDYTYKIAEYFKNKYQTLFAVHEKTCKNKRNRITSYYHAHIVLNSVSFIDGMMYSHTKRDIAEFIEYITSVTGDKNWYIKYN